MFGNDEGLEPTASSVDSDFREKFVDIFINKVGKAQETDPTHF